MRQAICGFAICILATSIAASADPVRITLVGDSTVETFDQSLTPGVWGWGQALPEFLDGDVIVTNQAKSGRSSKNFITEGLWNTALTTNPDYVLIQFGHNDLPDKGEDHATLPTPMPAVLPPSPTPGWRPIDYYRHNMETYVNDARAIGAVPILVTPMERRNFRSNHTIIEWNLPYALAAIDVGAAMNVPVIDLNTFGVETYESVSLAESLKYHYFNGASYDITHFSPTGARLFAKEVARELSDIPELAAHVVPEPTAAVMMICGIPLLLRRRQRLPA